MFSLICVWMNSWVNNREAGDLRRYRAHYDVIVMSTHTLTIIHIWLNNTQPYRWIQRKYWLLYPSIPIHIPSKKIAMGNFNFPYIVPSQHIRANTCIRITHLPYSSQIMSKGSLKFLAFSKTKNIAVRPLFICICIALLNPPLYMHVTQRYT